MKEPWKAVLHPDRRLDQRYGVSPMSSRPYPVLRDTTCIVVARPSRTVIVDAVLIESLGRADEWMIEDAWIAGMSLRHAQGTRFLEMPIFGSDSGNKIPPTTVPANQTFSLNARYIGKNPKGEVLVVAWYGSPSP